ncbi:MAG: GNAT family N-acetyltransferase [Chitinophagaceae bacterium]|nr:GNAT family N-acetyltransferase [Chitinophagaceae bacterium]
MQLNWTTKKFDNLTPHELYAIMQLRNEVFVLEQNCIYQDADGKDLHAWHYMGWNEYGQLMAYTRLLPEGVSYDVPSIGRVVTHADVRRLGAGKELMSKSIETCYHLFGASDIKIGAQLYLKSFYESFGFMQTGNVYLEDGIEHIEMLLKFKK